MTANQNAMAPAESDWTDPTAVSQSAAEATREGS